LKYLLISLLCCVSLFSISQPVSQRASDAITVMDGNLFAKNSFRPAVFSDTIAATISLDSCGKLIYTYSNDSYWFRSCYPVKHWVKFLKFGDAASITNASGTGDTLLINNSIKRLNPGYGIDHLLTATNITQSVDTSEIATQYDLSQQGIQQTLTIGDTALRQIIWKDTTVSGSSGSMNFMTFRPSNYGTVYTNGVSELFTTSLARFNGVNPDGRPNVVYNFLGYNVTAGGGRINTSEAAFRFAAETHFQLDISQNPSFEIHIPEITTFSGSIYRPFSMYIRKNSGFTNTNMQIDQLNLARRSNGVNWSSHAYDSNVTVNYTPDDNGKRVAINANLPNFIGTMVYDSTGWSISSTVTNSTKQFATNLPIRYGASNNRSGMDGYGDVTFREGKITMFNTGTNTTFADWQFGGSQKFNFTKDNAVFSVSLLTVGSANIVPVGGSKILSANGEALLISSSGGAGSDIRFLNGIDNARQVTIFQAGSGAGNVNIGTSTINPARKLKVQGSVGVDSNLYVAMHAISADVDSAVVWDRGTNVYKVAKINGTTYAFSNGITNTSGAVTLGGNLTNNTTIGSITDNFGLTFNRLGTSNASTIAAVSNTGNALNATSTSGTAFIARSTSGLGGLVGINPSSTNSVVEVLRVERSTSGTAADGIGGYIGFSTETDNGSLQESGRISSELTTAANATRTSAMKFYTINSASSNVSLTIDGDGTITTTGRRKLAVVTSADGTLTLGNAEAYIFNGTTTTWTLPPVSGTTGLIYYIKNIGSGSITLNADSGNNEIYSTSAVNTITVTAGSAIILISNNTYFTVN
jgi:hypothetical protein